MLRRIGTANEEIVEILLSKNRVLSALRFARQTLALESISARKFLEAAQNTQDANIFYGGIITLITTIRSYILLIRN